MKWFANVKTLDELRREYRRLAIIHHPDKGGDTATMQEINEQYSKLSAKLINGNTSYSEDQKRHEHKVSEDLRVQLNKIVSLPGIIIELIGNWIWVTGNTYPVKDILKESGYRFSNSKVAWYWHNGEYSKKSGKLLSMDEIRDAWGTQVINSTESQNYYIR